ncbi:right-handed parallel beta-helix repeat-containing protein [Salinispora sp. H7-4]|uniref:right-handed parallel beta-helix repeat-containing protein n=1 Tax=Salinispora sp. H7-4 TaxID=2748321 RepID=UPI0015D0F346|nr:right-handed parallel beta-helix repeat-containing protein [Salinispora sp. H7-4]NYT95608.1 right-handed parallel beta-helix repeat-containing protein [Salinispora sp. H7-4]
MNQQHHTHETGTDRPGVRRARSRWWTVGLAGVAGLALTAVGVATAPAVGAAGRAATSAETQPGGSHRDSSSTHEDRSKGDRGKGDRGKGDRNKGDRGKGKKAAPKGTPVPCDADLLIAAITSANATGGGVFDLAKDCTYLLTFDIDGAGLPAIMTPITLNGGKNTTIERAAAVDDFRIFIVDTGGDLTLNHLKVTGGQTDGNGGGVLVNPGGALTTNHSAITRNIVEGDGDGGGIANLGTTRIMHSKVDWNTTSEQGGGIFSTGLLEVVKSHIDNNTADQGGGIYQSGSTVTVRGSSISGNQASDAGGLYLLGGIGRLTGTKVAKNTASGNGGGARVAEAGQLTLQKVGLLDNSALTGVAGGLFVEGTEVDDTIAVVEDSLIENNTASDIGGGIDNSGVAVLRNTKVIGNQANEGGGIFNSGTLTLFATKVVKNIAVTDGGGIFNTLGTVELNTATGTVVIKNRPNNCVDVPGCAG